MELLVNNGLIERRRGVGSVVVSNRPSSALSGVSETLKKTMGDDEPPEKEVVSADYVPADEELASIFKVTAGTDLYRLERIRVSAGHPYYHEVVYLECSYAPDAIEHDFSAESLRAYYSYVLHVKWSNANQRVSAEAADPYIARLLDVNEGAPLLAVSRISYDASGIPREYVMSRYRADYYYFDIMLSAGM